MSDRNKITEPVNNKVTQTQLNKINISAGLHPKRKMFPRHASIIIISSGKTFTAYQWLCTIIFSLQYPLFLQRQIKFLQMELLVFLTWTAKPVAVFFLKTFSSMITKTLNSWRRVTALRFIVAVSETHINSF